MAKGDGIELEAKVIEILPNSTFRLEIIDSGIQVIGHLSGKLRLHNIRILMDDKVKVEVSPYDPSKGRITWRLKK